MKTLILLLLSIMLAMLSAYFANPLVILAVLFPLVTLEYYRQAMLLAFMAGVFYSLFSAGTGLLGLGGLSLVLLAALLAAVLVKVYLARPRIIDLLMAVTLILLANLILFGTLAARSLVLLITLYLLLSIVAPHIIRAIRRPRHLRIK